MSSYLSTLNVSSLSYEQLQDVLNGPALDPPPGVVPHITNRATDLYWWYLSVTFSITVLGIFVLLRLYTKIFVVRKFDLADCKYSILFPYQSYQWNLTNVIEGLIIAGFAGFVGELALGRLCIPHGAGAHQWTVQVKELFELLYLMNIAEILYGPWVFIVKMSVLLQYFRIFAPNRTVNPLVFNATWAIVVACGLFYTADTLLTIFACWPREKIWNKFYDGGHCINYHAVVVSSGFFNIVSDLIMLLLPVQTIWKMQIPKKNKFGIIFLFTTGFLAIIASAMRVFYTWRIMGNELALDVSRNIVLMGLWSYVEIGLGLTVACTISLPKLMKAKGWKFGSLFSVRARSLGSFGNFMEQFSFRQRMPPSSDELAIDRTKSEESV